ncbi:unnamed protein product [Phyllotreta striolata]|uniref:S1 motif domain-containing protein n=1 Tax=Phyllotreta striolata TaxID=444603 RepID=A0A9N9TFL2_PHYSR|nr:unnamed protein product [Phyllotreta striolata]
MSNWSCSVISDDEDEEIVNTRNKKTKSTRSLKKESSFVLISDDEEEPPVRIAKRIKNEKNKPNNEIMLTSDDSDEDDTTIVIPKTEKSVKKEKIDVRNIDNIEPASSSSTENNQRSMKISNRQPMKRKNNCTDNHIDVKLEKLDKPYKPQAKRIKLEPGKESVKIEPIWEDYQLLAENLNLSDGVAQNVVQLFSEGNTIPFIARYRRAATENMSPETLREARNVYDDICLLKHEIGTFASELQKTGNLTETLETTIKLTKNLEELEIIRAPFKPEAKKTLAERAKALGLEKPAMDLLQNNSNTDLTKFISGNQEELNNAEKGIVHIIAQRIATDTDVLTYLRDLRKHTKFAIETKKHKVSKQKSDKPKKGEKKQLDVSVFEQYFNFSGFAHSIKPHTVLAINRGESHKILSVKVVVPEYLYKKFHQFCIQKWSVRDGIRKTVIEEAIKDSYNRLVEPFIVREIRSELKAMAEKASYDVFGKNLKQILMAAPIKGQAILGIDPGFTHGCKIAVISPIGAVLDHTVIYPHSTHNKKQTAAKELKRLLQENECTLIALGDGTACKETEQWLTELISQKYFHTNDVKYTIVSEDGASIYSCSPEAKKEFGELDTNIISAVSLARRIQDPMAELVKVDPKHLGVGMYQHDLKQKRLDEVLEEIVSECVSFVGVDLNTSSQALLRRVAGLTDKRASEIVKYRERNGPFTCRSEIKNVPGIGPKAFQQCAGFLRIGPTNATSFEEFYKRPNTTKLDQTYIHPESYEVALQLLKELKLRVNDIGEPGFVDKIASCRSKFGDSKLNVGGVLDLVFEALSKPLNYDLRTEISQTAFFSTGLRNIDDLKEGDQVMGRVKNVTHFGCFVDIGVGRDGLIHCSNFNEFQLQVGDRVEVVVLRLDRERKRIQLGPIAKL